MFITPGKPVASVLRLIDIQDDDSSADVPSFFGRERELVQSEVFRGAGLVGHPSDRAWSSFHPE